MIMQVKDKKAEELFEKGIELRKELNRTISELTEIDEQAGSELIEYLNEEVGDGF